MKIGCLMVTERRPFVIGVALAAFFDQHFANKELFIISDGRRRSERNHEVDYAEALSRFVNPDITYTTSPLHGTKTVCQRLDEGCRILFEERGCDVVAVWDDDDWKYPRFLTDLANFFSKPDSEKFYFTGCKWSHYVNARHLYAESPRDKGAGNWGYTGCSIAYRHTAWDQHKMSEFQFEGYDPAFCQAFEKVHWGPPVSDNPLDVLSLCHGQNVYQHCHGGGHDLKPWIRANLSTLAADEMFRTRDYMIAQEIEPPQINRPY